MKDDVDNVSEVLLDPDDSSNVRFKRSIIQINRSNNSTPISEFIRGVQVQNADSHAILFKLFCSNFKLYTTTPLLQKSAPKLFRFRLKNYTHLFSQKYTL